MGEESIEDILEYTFKDRSLIEKAFTIGGGKPLLGYERLEFLGDRVVGLIVAALAYEAFPEEREGDLAKRYAHLVNAETLSELAERLGFRQFVTSSDNTVAMDGKSKVLMGDVCEAVVGALYLDGGMEAAERFVHKYLKPIMLEMKEPPVDAKSKIQEWALKKNHSLPDYRFVKRHGEDHCPVFTVELRVKGLESVTAEGSSKRDASRKAAEKMLLQIKD